MSIRLRSPSYLPSAARREGLNPSRARPAHTHASPRTPAYAREGKGGPGRRVGGFEALTLGRGRPKHVRPFRAHARAYAREDRWRVRRPLGRVNRARGFPGLAISEAHALVPPHTRVRVRVTAGPPRRVERLEAPTLGGPAQACTHCFPVRPRVLHVESRKGARREGQVGPRARVRAEGAYVSR